MKKINIIQKKFARKELCGNVKTRKKSSASWNLLEYSSRAPTTVKRAKTKKAIPIAKVRKWYENKVGVMNSEIQRE